MNLTAMSNSQVTPEALKTKAKVMMKSACNQMADKNLYDAYISFGFALAYEELYDLQQKNPDINSLYRDDEEYKALCLKWVDLKKVYGNPKICPCA